MEDKIQIVLEHNINHITSFNLIKSDDLKIDIFSSILGLLECKYTILF